eukprot:TRINITY_DN9001_c0_g1_i3.p1 TRINITY_DN9001_c0_g1~~TRINITY_DN9001_c0_g1_i3.p1  ORF type:complete len:385 (-),score=45.74 TRINITY_DN9001_c0_g1_i3:118-1272(-)
MIGEDSYNKAAALDFVEFARVAFCTEEAIKAWDCGEMCDQNPVDRSSVRLIGPGSHSGVMAYAVPRTALGRQDDTGHSCVLAFRGSVNTKNWFADADAELVPWPGGQYSSWCQGCKVHRGFAGAYSELQEEAVSVLNSLQCSSVAVTGHSLGAAIATVAALDLRRQHHFIIDALWTFGSPRVGNREFVYHWLSAAAKQSTARNATWRVVHYRDPIPQLAMNGEYWHVPQEVWYTERYSDKYEVCGWTHDALENFSCGMWRVTPSELAEGTLSGDHVHYLGKSFALSDMNSRCRPENICIQAGYVSPFKAVLLAVGSFVAGALTVCCFGRCKARFRSSRQRVVSAAATPATADVAAIADASAERGGSHEQPARADGHRPLIHSAV